VAGAKRPDTDPFGLLMPMLELLGDITNRRVLDADAERVISPGR